MPPLTPVYSMSQPNESIWLYEGPFKLGGNDETATFRFEWLPSQRVRFDVPELANYPRDFATNMQMPASAAPANAFVLGTHIGSDRPTSLSGSVNGKLDIGPGTGLSHIIFHIPNFKECLIARNDVPPEELANDWTPNRIKMEAEGWKVTLDSIERGSAIFEKLDEVGGYQITHVGKLERTDGRCFSFAEVSQVFECLYLLLSFVRGFWVHPILPVGFDAQGGCCWERWAYWRLDSWKNRPSWCDRNCGKFAASILPGLVRRRMDPIWGHPIRLGIEWYVESNRGAVNQELSIISIQATLEMLASTLFVEDLGTVTERDHDSPRYPAHRKVRELLEWAGIPTLFPACLSNLGKVATDQGWVDGPAAFTSTRNWFGHPTRKNREKFATMTGLAISEAYTLGLWYLELVLLRLLDYQGDYGNRLNQSWVGQLEAVPWRVV